MNINVATDTLAESTTAPRSPRSPRASSGVAPAPSAPADGPAGREWCLWRFFEQAVTHNPQPTRSPVAMVDSDGRPPVTYAQLFSDAEQLDRWLRHAGVDKGDVVMLVGHITPWCVTSAATAAAAAVACNWFTRTSFLLSGPKVHPCHAMR